MAGIDTERVRRKAVEKGLIDDDVELEKDRSLTSSLPPVSAPRTW